MTKQEIKDYLISSMDTYGLLPFPSDNRIKSTTEFYLLCKQMKILTKKDIKRYDKAVKSLMIKKGLIVRYPNSPIKDIVDQHDNYVSISSSFNLSNSFKKFSRWFMLYGVTHFFRYDHRQHFNGFIDWLSCFRQPYHLAIFTLNAGFIFTSLRFILGVLVYSLFALFSPIWLSIILGLIVAGIIDYIHLCGAIILVSLRPKEDTSGKLLMWQFTQTKCFYRFLVYLAIIIFKRNLKKQYGEFIIENLFKIYYGDNSLLYKFSKGVQVNEKL